MTDELPLLGVPDAGVAAGGERAARPRLWPAGIARARRRPHRLAGSWVGQPWGRMRVWRAGAGAPLLAVHGLGGSGRYWQGLLDALAGGRDLLAPDLCGFGGSDKPAAVSYDLDLHVDALELAVRAWSPAQPVTVVGHSLGAVIATASAAAHTERVSRLVLVCAPYPRVSPDAQWCGGESYRRGRRRAAEGVQSAIRAAWPVLAPLIRLDRFPREVIRDYQEHTLRSYWGTAIQVMQRTEIAPRVEPLAASGVARLLLNGTQDRRVSRADADSWERALGGADRTVVPGGHQLLLATGFAPLVPLLAPAD